MNEERYIWKIMENWQDIIYDKKTNKRLRTDKESIVSLLNQQAQRIAELEEQLADMTKKYELASLPIGGLVDTAKNLEKQLTEKEREANDWKQRFESSEERFKTFNSNSVTALNLKNEKIEELKQQLTEKEKELDDWKDGTIIVKWCELEKALELTCKDLSDAIDMLRECGKNDLAGVLEDSPDYFKQKAKFKKEL